MAKKKKKRRIRAEIKMYVVLFSLLASMIAMMIIHKPDSEVSMIPPTGSNTGEKVASNIVVLDPGHGGYDSGSQYGSIYEKDITLSIAKLVGKYLHDKGIQVVYTRNEDVALADYELSDLQARIDIGVKEQAVYFVSLHMNESPSEERSNGFEVFQSDSSDKSIYLAEQVSDLLEKVNYTQRRSILGGDNLHVINFNPIPAVLIEMGFMSDDEDRTYLISSNGQQKIATAIGEAIVTSMQYFE